MSDTAQYALCGSAPDAKLGFAVRHPDTGVLVDQHTLPNPYCHRPQTFSREEAEAAAAVLQRDTGIPWRLMLAPKPCAKCRRVIRADDLDFCYPRNRELTRWRAGCNETDGGCGFEVEGGSFQDTMAAWNAA